MVTNSGLVLDAVTHQGIYGVAVYSFSPTQSGIIGLYNTEPNGYFSVVVPDTGDVIFAPYLNGYLGYSCRLATNVSPILLYMHKTNSIPDASGIGNLILQNRAHTTSSNIRDVQHSPTELYCITEAGLDIIDSNSLLNVGYITYTDGFSCLNVSPLYSVRSGVLLGTTNSGVLEFSIPSSGYSIDSRNLNSLLKVKYNTQSQSITSNNIQCVHKSEVGGTVFGTLSGIDHYTARGAHWKHTFASGIGVTACRISDYGDVYYSPTGSGLYVKYGPITADWSVPDYIISISGTGSNPFPLLTGKINDIKLTSISGANEVILATASGLIVYEENRSNLNISASGAKLLRNYP